MTLHLLPLQLQASSSSSSAFTSSVYLSASAWPSIYSTICSNTISCTSAYFIRYSKSVASLPEDQILSPQPLPPLPLPPCLCPPIPLHIRLLFVRGIAIRHCTGLARRSCIDRQFEKDAVQPTQENTTNQRKREREREKREESVSLADILGESPVVLRLRVYLCLRGVLCCLLLDSSLISVPSCYLFLSCYFITLLSVVRLILQSKEKDQSIKKKVDSKRKTKRQETKPSSCSAFSSLFSALVLLFFCGQILLHKPKSHNQHQPPLQLKLPAKEKKESNRKSRKTRRSGTNHHYLEL